MICELSNKFNSLINLAVLCLMAVVCGIVDAILEIRNYPKGALWLYNDIKTDDSPHINGLITFLNAFITFQNVIPISLYVSIEFVRTAQAAFIYFDPDMNYVKPGQKPEDGKPTLARSWNLADDLGQIEYIFSDKTGTLTQVCAYLVIGDTGRVPGCSWTKRLILCL